MLTADQKREEKAEPLEYRSLEVRAATINKDERSVECLVSSETPVPMFDWERGEFVDEILLTDGCSIPRSRQVPLLNTHMRYSLDDVLGSARSLKRAEDGVVARLNFSTLAQEQFTRVEEGHITDVSAGYRVDEKIFVPRGERKKIGERSFTGPVNVVTKWRLREVSLVPIGADEQAKLRQVPPGELPGSKTRTGELKMEKWLRDLLVARGMPADLDDIAAVKWFGEHRSEVIVALETVKGGQGDDDDEDRLDLTKLVNDAVAKAVPEVINLQKERAARSRAEVDALLEVAGIEDHDLRDRCYAFEDAAKARAEILKFRKENTVDVGAFPNDGLARGTVRTSVEKFTNVMGNALLMRTFNGNEELAKRVCDEEIKYNRATPFGETVSWEERKKLGEGFRLYSHLGLLQFATECLRFEGIRDVNRLAPWQIAQAALGYRREAGVREYGWDTPGRSTPGYITSGTLANITVLDAMNKTMLAGYVERPFTWEGPFRRAPSVKDFRKVYKIRMSEFPSLEATPDNKEPSLASLADEKESYGVDAYSKAISFSWQAIVNDDQDAFSRVPRMMGVAANRTVNTFAWAMVESNALLQDGVAWFSAATGARKKANLIASGSGAPTIARLGALRTLLRLQVGVNTPEAAASETILDIEPAYIIYGVTLQQTIEQLVKSPFDPVASTFQQYNPFNQGNKALIHVCEPLIDAQTNGTTSFMLWASPNQVDTAEIAFLQGQETPFTRNYMDNGTMAMIWQIWQSFGGKPIDFRGVVRDKGIA